MLLLYWMNYNKMRTKLVVVSYLLSLGLMSAYLESQIGFLLVMF
jgi:hypothetical protein